MSWTKKNVRAADIVKAGDMVEVVVLGVNPADKRIALGLKQALGDPWEEALKKYPVGATVEGPVTSLAKFGAFVDLGDGIEGMIHIGDISHEKRLNHPSEALKVGEKVQAQVLEADKERRRLRLGIKQLRADQHRRIPGRAQSRRHGQRTDRRRFRQAGEGRTGRGRDRHAKLPEQRPREAPVSRVKSRCFLAEAMLPRSGNRAAGRSRRPRLASRADPQLQDHSIDPAQKKIEVGTGSDRGVKVSSLVTV